MVTRIAVIGPGAIGGTVAVHLSQVRGNAVTVCARTPVDQLTVETAGGQLTIVPELLALPKQGQPQDWLLVATKAYDVVATASWLPGLTGPATRVGVLQNGVEHVERFAPYVPESRIVPVIVDMPVERVGAGRFRQRGAGRLTVLAGLDGKRSPAFSGAAAWRFPPPPIFGRRPGGNWR